MKKNCARTRIGLSDIPVPKKYVNLDALIPREDIYSKEQVTQATRQDDTVKISELDERSIWFKSLHKPDFQRETASWEPEKIADLIECFVNGHFIPALVMWRAEDGKIFAIDGAHRLSALIAWARDDYGDRDTSIRFFRNEIPTEQKKVAEKTRDLVNKRIGAFSEMAKIIENPHAPEEKKRQARNAGTLPLTIQWVTGTAETAEKSFLKINQSSTPIDPTEFQMIQSRHKPNAITARALIRAGVGHKYWSGLPKEAQGEIEKASKEIYDMLFIPPLEIPIKTLDLPVAGQGYSAESVRLIFDFVNLANDMLASQSKLKEVPNDLDGTKTVEFLKKTKRIIARICSDDNGSLGLHPAVYFYSASGRYQPTAFLAAVSLIMELETTNRFDWFTQHRSKFEEFLLNHRYFINQIVGQFGSGFKAHGWIVTLYKEILEMVANGKESEIAKTLTESNKWRLKEIVKTDGKFSANTKTYIVLRDSLKSALICNICGSRLHRNSMQIDHIIRREDGGSGNANNGQPTHPYCNTGYKEKLASQSR